MKWTNLNLPKGCFHRVRGKSQLVEVPDSGKCFYHPTKCIRDEGDGIKSVSIPEDMVIELIPKEKAMSGNFGRSDIFFINALKFIEDQIQFKAE